MMDRLLERDWFLRSVSLVVAIFIWFQVAEIRNPQITEIFSGIPLEITGLGDDEVIIDQGVPKEVTLEVSGQRKVLSGLSRNDFRAVVDLNGAAPGGPSYYNVEVEVPAGVELAQVNPRTISLTIDQVETKRVPVAVNVTGSLDQEYAVGTPTTSPEEVTIRGPSRWVRLVERAVGRVDVSGATADVKIQSALRAVDSKGDEVLRVSVMPATTNITVPVAKLPPAKMVKVQPQVTGEPAEGYTVVGYEVLPETAQIRASTEILAGIEELMTKPFDITGAASDRRVEVDLELPDGVSRVNPSRVEVVVRVSPDRIQVPLNGINIGVINQPENTKLTFRPLQGDITVEGLREDMENLDPTDVRLYIDLSGLSEGVHVVKTLVAVPPEIELVEVNPLEVIVSLEKVEPPPEEPGQGDEMPNSS